MIFFEEMLNFLIFNLYHPFAFKLLPACSIVQIISPHCLLFCKPTNIYYRLEELSAGIAQSHRYSSSKPLIGRHTCFFFVFCISFVVFLGVSAWVSLYLN